MLKQGSSDPTSPRREASLFDLPGSSEPGLFFQGLSRTAAPNTGISPGVPPGSQCTALGPACSVAGRRTASGQAKPRDRRLESRRCELVIRTTRALPIQVGMRLASELEQRENIGRRALFHTDAPGGPYAGSWGHSVGLGPRCGLRRLRCSRMAVAGARLAVTMRIATASLGKNSRTSSAHETIRRAAESGAPRGTARTPDRCHASCRSQA
jgi:hypothetical protein